MKTAYFDCFSGISGDMTVGALLDAGADFESLREALDSLGVPGFAVEAEKVVKRGIAATQFRVILDPDHAPPHRHLRDVVAIIEAGALPEAVKTVAVETFELLAEAEAAVHSSTKDAVHFHEVGAIDSIVDIVAAHFALHLLGVERVCASVVQVGSGTIECDHGILPVPAPATAKLLEGKPTAGGGPGELTTPTGAALLAQCASSFGGAPAMTVRCIGYGSGTRDLPDRANVLRVFLGESENQGSTEGFEERLAGMFRDVEAVVVVDATIDDMNPELFPPLIEALLAQGARDAFLTPVLGKKGRPGHNLTVLCDEAVLSEITEAVFKNSTTLGLRMHQEHRRVLARSWDDVETPWGRVRIKVGHLDGTRNVMAPEFEDCAALAKEAGVSVRSVYEAALAAARKGERENA